MAWRYAAETSNAHLLKEAERSKREATCQLGHYQLRQTLGVQARAQEGSSVPTIISVLFVGMALGPPLSAPAGPNSLDSWPLSARKPSCELCSSIRPAGFRALSRRILAS